MAKHIYQDAEGELWLDPGDGGLLALDDSLCRRLMAAWPEQPRPEIEKEFGPLIEWGPRRGVCDG